MKLCNCIKSSASFERRFLLSHSMLSPVDQQCHTSDLGVVECTLGMTLMNSMVLICQDMLCSNHEKGAIYPCSKGRGMLRAARPVSWNSEIVEFSLLKFP
jgi:hypothetical protein